MKKVTNPNWFTHLNDAMVVLWAILKCKINNQYIALTFKKTYHNGTIFQKYLLRNLYWFEFKSKTVKIWAIFNGIYCLEDIKFVHLKYMYYNYTKKNQAYFYELKNIS